MESQVLRWIIWTRPVVEEAHGDLHYRRGEEGRTPTTLPVYPTYTFENVWSHTVYRYFRREYTRIRDLDEHVRVKVSPGALNE